MQTAQNQNLPFYPVPIRTVYQAGEWMSIHPNGFIERQAPYTVKPSQQWRVTGAVTYSQNGYGVSRYWSLAEVLTNPAGIPWKFKNAKQRTHIRDFDHGANREWGSPAHLVY